MGTLALCMIVKDEAEGIERSLESFKPFIDYWVICDTGSSDDTPAIIERVLEGIPGELHHDAWQDFGHNRSLLMERAHTKADHLLLMDADWTLEVTPGAFDNLRADSYMVVHSGAIEFHNKRVVSGAIPWRYVGATHEYVTSPDEKVCERLDGVVIHVESIGGSRTGRWQRDRVLLEAELAKDPTDSRSAFYLAQTLKDMGHESGDRGLLAEARAAYEHRATMEGWVEENYCALHVAGSLAAELDDWPGAAELYAAAWEVRPARLEAAHDLAQGWRARGRYHAAHRFTSLAAGLQPLPVPDDNLFVAPWIYRWGLLFEYSITSYWVGQPKVCVAACDALLKLADLPPGHREQTQRNRNHGLRAQAQQMASGTASHTGQRR